MSIRAKGIYIIPQIMVMLVLVTFLIHVLRPRTPINFCKTNTISDANGDAVPSTPGVFKNKVKRSFPGGNLGEFHIGSGISVARVPVIFGQGTELTHRLIDQTDLNSIFRPPIS